MADADGIRVAELWVYPIKSARGIRLPHAAVTAGGFALDRRWMVVDASGQFVTQRSHPALARAVVAITNAELCVTAPDLPRLAVPLAPPPDAPAVRATVWDDTCDALAAGDDANAWFSRLLGEACALVYVPDAALRTVSAKYSGAGERVGFADAFPFLLASTGSLAELNARLATPVPMDRFRPNIVVDGCAPFAEDRWDWIRAGALAFRVAKPCSRCAVVNVDQQSGARGKEPLATLATFRTRDGKVCFGQNLVHRGEGTVREGDVVEVVSLANGD
jgi:uncharacterized protein YcbX